MAEGDLLDAREAMQILGINENELQTLVARGDLRAFRSAGTMKFRRDDVGSLKAEKGTEPTIIIPAAGAKKTGGSGILPALGSAPAKPPSRVASAVHPVATGGTPAEQTGEIVLEDIELMPTDDAAGTQQVTIQTGVQTGHQTGIGGQTVIESGQTSGVTSGVITGQMTVMEDAPQVATGEATAVGSGRRPAPMPAGTPAMSRVQRAAAAPGVSMATSRRTAAVYQPKPAHPFMTAIMIVNTVLFAFTASICAVMMTRGHFDQQSQQRIIPPFLNHGSSTPVYRWMYHNTPGDPQDKKPMGEFDGEIKGNQ